MEKLPHVVRITVSVTLFVRFMKWDYLILWFLSSTVFPLRSSDLSAQRDVGVLSLLIRFSSLQKKKTCKTLHVREKETHWQLLNLKSQGF